MCCDHGLVVAYGLPGPRSFLAVRFERIRGAECVAEVRVIHKAVPLPRKLISYVVKSRRCQTSTVGVLEHAPRRAYEQITGPADFQM